MADEPIAPFGVTVAMVKALLPDATIPDAQPAGVKGVTISQVQRWLTERSAAVEDAIDGWTTLDGDKQERITTRACAVTVTGAASITQAARFPEKQGGSTASYADVLWARYETELEELAQRVAAWLADVAAVSTGGPAGSFPDPVILDGMRW